MLRELRNGTYVQKRFLGMQDAINILIRFRIIYLIIR